MRKNRLYLTLDECVELSERVPFFTLRENTDSIYYIGNLKHYTVEIRRYKRNEEQDPEDVKNFDMLVHYKWIPIGPYGGHNKIKNEFEQISNSKKVLYHQKDMIHLEGVAKARKMLREK